MAAADKVFAGSIPEIYDRYLVSPYLDAYALDLAKRVAESGPQDVLEVAAGTGALTRTMASRLPACVHIVATDLNQPMLDHAKARQSHASGIEWKQANALAQPFRDERFDVVACQFGVMFFPDKIQGYKEAQRLGRLEVEYQLNFGGLLHRQIGWLFSLRDTAHVVALQAIGIGDIGAVTTRGGGWDWDGSHLPELLLKDGVIGRPSLWIAEDFGCCASG